MFASLLISLALVNAATPSGSATDWPDYRGPDGSGHTVSSGLPLKWSESEHIAWKTPVHGRGWSTPVIQNGRIWFTTATDDGREMFVLCVDRETGRVLLDRKLFTNAEVDAISDVNSYASPSPVVEPGRVYAHFGTYGTACINAKTFDTIWTRRDLHCKHSVGPGASPIVFQDLLILTLDGIDNQFMVALDKKTGKTVWTKERSIMKELAAAGKLPEPERRKSFCTPLLVDGKGDPLLVCPAAAAVCAYEPRSGEEIWRVRIGGGYSIGSRPIAGGGMVYINTGYDRSEVWGIKLGGKGDVTDSMVAWKYNRNMPFKPSPIFVDGLFFAVNDSGVITCLDALSGAEVWKERIGGSFSSSPLYSDGRLYLCDEGGKTTVIKPGRKLEVLAENTLETGLMASPAVSGRSLFLRTKKALYRIDP